MVKKYIFILLLCAFLTSAFAQSNSQTVGSFICEEDFAQLTYADIPGAAKLSKPTLILGEAKPVMGEGMGWAAPAVFDWNSDGKKDLLVGEFASGLEWGQNVGNFIRVYLNIGTNSQPMFGDDFEYARPPMFVDAGFGTPLSIHTWCCMPFRPQFADLDGDGYKDLVAGQYHPGDVIWFRGSKNGFLSGKKIDQEGNPQANDYNLPGTDINSFLYWNFSSVSFGDVDGDGDQDMFVGGSALRLSRNLGTKSNPKFGYRELLLDVHGQPLKIYEATEKDLVKTPTYKSDHISGSYCTSPVVFDWDNDKTLDLLVTSGYYKNGEVAVMFFRGVKTSKGYRFMKGIPLFSAKDQTKAFPGSWLNIFVADWNDDGVTDLLIGASVVTTDNKFNSALSWKWEEEAGILKKNPGLYNSELLKKIGDQIEKAERGEMGVWTKASLIKNYYGDEDYGSFIHKGLVFVMLGSK